MPRVKVKSLSPYLRDALIDYKFLLNRGYNRASALELVVARYMLSKRERILLYRSVFSDKEISERSRKKLSLWQVRGKQVFFDGFNVLTVIRSSLMGEEIILCEDFFVRDLYSYTRKIQIDDKLYESLEILIKIIKKFKIFPTIIYDEPVSKSGIFSKFTRELIKKYKIIGNSFTLKTVDMYLVKSGAIIASSDSYIISKAKNVVDVGGYIALNLASNIISIPKVLAVFRTHLKALAIS